jgi:hypothetical protein
MLLPLKASEIIYKKAALLWHQKLGPGKSMYALPVTFRFPLCYIRVLPAGRGGGGKWKVGDVRREVHMLIYPDLQKFGEIDTWASTTFLAKQPLGMTSDPPDPPIPHFVWKSEVR